ETAAAPAQPANQPASQPANQPSGQPEWLMPPEPPARGDSGRDRILLDLLPTGVLIYRLDRLLYANPAFLERMGYPSLHALEQAGGLDALYVEPGVNTSGATGTSEAGVRHEPRGTRHAGDDGGEPAGCRARGTYGSAAVHDLMGWRFRPRFDV